MPKMALCLGNSIRPTLLLLVLLMAVCQDLMETVGYAKDQASPLTMSERSNNLLLPIVINWSSSPHRQQYADITRVTLRHRQTRDVRQ